jgi:hypothetical protein
MAELTVSETGSVVLTREELTLVTRAVGSTELPGVGAEPPDRLGGAQEAYGQAYAQRSLRARGLATVDAERHLVVASSLVRLVQTCTHARQALWLFRMSPGAATMQAFGYVGDESVVLHTKPELLLHEFATLPNEAALIERIVALAGCAALPNGAGTPLVIPAETIARARRIAAERDVRGAATALEDGGVDDANAAAIATTLAGAHSVSVFVHLVPQPDGTFDREEITVLHGGGAAWAMTQPSGDRAEPAALEPVDSAGLAALLGGWLLEPAGARTRSQEAAV